MHRSIFFNFAEAQITWKIQENSGDFQLPPQKFYRSLMILGDVCDDREQLAAIFDEQNGGHYHGGGDGMSSASDSDTKEGGATTSSENLLQV